MPPPPTNSALQLIDRFRVASPGDVQLHPQEKWSLITACAYFCFLPWALGSMHAWSQCTGLVLAAVAFVVAAIPRHYSAEQTGAEPVVARPLQRLWRFPLFWLGLAFLGYIVLQGLNPAWRYRANTSYWWIEPVKHLSWLPSSMSVPFKDAGPWRALIIHTGAWVAVCAVWIGFMRRKTFRLFFTTLLVNGLVLTLLGLAQMVSHAQGVFWTIPVSTAQYFIATFIYRNHAGAYLNLILAIGTGLAWWHSARSSRHFHKSSPAGVFAFAAALIAVMVLFTHSRGAAIMLISFCLVAGLAYLISHFRSPVHERNTVAMLIMVLLVVTFVGTSMYSLNFETVWKRFAGMVANPMASAHDRNEARAAAEEMFADKPVFGWGAGCFRYGFPNYASQHPSIYYVGTGSRRFWEHAHSDLIEYPVEYGIAGMLPLACGAVWILWQAVRRRLWDNPFALPVFCGAGITVVHAWGEFVFQNPAILATWAVALLGSLRWAEQDFKSLQEMALPRPNPASLPPSKSAWIDNQSRSASFAPKPSPIRQPNLGARKPGKPMRPAPARADSTALPPAPASAAEPSGAGATGDQSTTVPPVPLPKPAVEVTPPTNSPGPSVDSASPNTVVPPTPPAKPRLKLRKRE